jgi:hypothetical protein
LLSLNPSDSHGTIGIGALLSGDRVAREILDATTVRELPDSVRKGLGRTAANRVLLDDSHTGLVRDILRWPESERAALCASHCMNEEMWTMLYEQENEHFLQRRESLLCETVDGFLRLRAEWDLPTLRPTEEYMEMESDEEAPGHHDHEAE